MRVAVLVPCYKRPEYTELCIRAIENAQEYNDVDFYLIDDGSRDRTYEILSNAKLESIVVSRRDNIGLRNTILDFFERVKADGSYEYLVKMDNDCEVPANWLSDLIHLMKTTDADILSPNVFPSNAAFTYGRENDGRGYRPSEIVGGLWCMKAALIDGLYFEPAGIGIRGAFNILKQIIMEKEPKVGWAENVTVQDIGHQSGLHPQHIKSDDHARYSAEVGRSVVWS